MIKIKDKKIDLFLEYYANGYSEIPGEAFVKAGFVNSLRDAAAPMLYRELMSKPKVSKFIEKFTKDQANCRRKVLTDEERLLYLSNLVRDSSLYCVDKSGNVVVKDAKHSVLAIKELNAMLSDQNPDHDAPHTVVQLNLGNLDEQTLEQLDLLVK